MHCKLASLLFVGAVTIAFLSLFWLCGSLVNSTTIFYEQKDHLNSLGELPHSMALRDESTHKRGQLSLLQFSEWNVLTDQGSKGREGGEYKPSSASERDSLHETNQESIVDDQENIYENFFEVPQKKQETQMNHDVNENTDSEQEKTSPLSDYDHAINKDIWLVGAEDPKEVVEEIEEEEVEKEAPSLVVTERTNSSQVQRVVLNVDTKSPEKDVYLEVPASLPGSFEIRQPFSLPVPFATLPLDQILHTGWLQTLKDFLHTIKPDTGLVTIVSSDYKYSEVLLNWLISALVQVDRPLSNVLVLSLDSSLHALLQRRGFACIHVPPEQLLQSVVINRLALTGHVAFTQVHILRLTVMRFINHWGFDVANYDTDAIIMKNPEPLYYHQYKSSDFIGSFGHFPQEMQREWGIAVCIGVVMTKNSKQTEQYWESMSKVLPETTNDQARLNVALKAMDIKWSNSPIGSRMSILREAWQGSGRGGFKATILPSVVVCRGGCSRHFRSHNYTSVYVWHRGGKHEDGKRKYAAGAGLWYLRTDWMTVSNGTTTKGLRWLKAVATH